MKLDPVGATYVSRVAIVATVRFVLVGRTGEQAGVMFEQECMSIEGEGEL